MSIFFNNCRCRDHIRLFEDPSAFFDLTRKQSDIAPTLKPGETCVVATYDEDGQILFGWYSLSRDSWVPDPITGEEVRVLFGKKLDSARLSKTKAAKAKPYKIFFDKVGNFKRRSTIS
jgi:hypothetical protein